VRVALADDSALFRRGLATLLSQGGVKVVAEARSGTEIVARASATNPDVVVLDIRMPPTFTDEGLQAAETLRARHPGLGVLVLSTYGETPYVTRLLERGSNGLGYLLKDRVDDIDTLLDALQRIARGESVIDADLVAQLFAQQRRTSELDRLTERERQILAGMAEGRANVGIGQRLFLSPKTVETHVASVFAKLELPSTPDENRRVLAVLKWLRTPAGRSAGS
jgi:DNA-binding NarL/FixJ family response regulator